MVEQLDGDASLLHRHLDAVRAGLDRLEHHIATIEAWADSLAGLLPGGGRLLVAGNGGSAALGLHLTAELVGRYLDERPPFSAIALTADVATLTALANDYGYDECFARQVAAHGRPGDVFLALSTSGRSPSVLRAVDIAARGELHTWALTGPGPNPLADRCQATVAVEAASTATVQELHQVVVHLLCAAFDERLRRTAGRDRTGPGRAAADRARPDRVAGLVQPRDG